MAILRRDSNQNQGQPREQSPNAITRRSEQSQMTRDPFQLMMRDPFQLMREMMINPWGLLQQSLGDRDIAWNPSFELRETDDAFLLKGDMPGVRQEDLDISLVGNNLQVSGTREQEQEQGEGTWHTYERSYGQFTRSFALPETADVDKVRCDLKDGVLSVVVPKKAGTAPHRRKIQIGSGTKA